MSNNERVAIAAHLHVVLRRKTGRVTDIEWLSVNQEYAKAIIRFAREKAVEDGHEDLSQWADKLEVACGFAPQDDGPDTLPPSDSSDPNDPNQPRYVGGLR